MRKPLSPQDWIAPREFHFCHCGKYLTLKGAKSDKHVVTCGICKYKHAAITPEAAKERQKTLELHDKLWKERLALAEKKKGRRDSFSILDREPECGVEDAKRKSLI